MSDAMELCPLADVAPDSSRRIDVNGHRIVLVRVGDDLYAIGDRCTHADVSLSEGEVDLDECTVECPRHGSEFSLETGEPLSLPAIKPSVSPIGGELSAGGRSLCRRASRGRRPDAPLAPSPRAPREPAQRPARGAVQSGR